MVIDAMPICRTVFASRRRVLALGGLVMLAAACDTSSPDEAEPPAVCLLAADDVPDSTDRIGCDDDFIALASRPLNASIPGARSAKVLVDRADGDALYYMNTGRYSRHFEFAAAFLSDEPLPPVLDIALFNQTEYQSPDRRFLLGAVTYYEAPDVWTYEIAPYDSSSPPMVQTAMALLADSAHFGRELRFHPTSANVEEMARPLPSSIDIVTTDELFADTDYQPLKLGTAFGQLRFYSARQLADAYVGPRDIVVLDSVPNDITVVAGVITSEPQTPLSHVNVLAQNRGTPNMALRGAFLNPDLRASKDQWVRLEVGAFDYRLEAATRADADDWWQAHRLPDVQVPSLDLEVTDLRDVERITLDDVPAFGGKAANYAILASLGDDVPVPKAFAVPVYFYEQFETQNRFDERIRALQADPQFVDDPGYRERALGDLQAAMATAPVDPAFEAMLVAKLEAEYPGLRMRFRSSTNAEEHV